MMAIRRRKSNHAKVIIRTTQITNEIETTEKESERERSSRSSAQEEN